MVMVTNELPRAIAVVMNALAARSLPVPVSPVSSTVDAGLVATRASSALTACIAGRQPDDGVEGVLASLARSQRPHLTPQLAVSRAPSRRAWPLRRG